MAWTRRMVTKHATCLVQEITRFSSVWSMPRKCLLPLLLLGVHHLGPVWGQEVGQPEPPRALELRSNVGVEAPAKIEALPSSAMPSPSTTVPGLGLAELEEMALSANPSLGRAAARVGAARGYQIQVGLPFNPVVGYDGQQVGSGGLAEQHGISVSQEFVRGGKLQLNRAVAGQDVARAQQELAAQQQRVLTDVRLAFYEVLAAQRQIDLTDQLVRVAAQGFDAADALFKGKQVGRTDLLQAQLETENSQILSRNAQNRHTAAWNRLTAVVGNPALPPQPLNGTLDGASAELQFQEIVQRIQATSPEVAAAMSAVMRARYAVDRARAEPRPNVTVQGLVNVVDNGIGGRPDGAVAVTLPVPLFNRNQGGIMQAQHEVAAAQQALAQLELDLQNRLTTVYERYANARNQVARYQEAILPAAQESLDLVRSSYTAGEVSFISLLTVQRTYAQTNVNYVEALRELRMAETEIEGLLLSGSLQARN